MSAGGAAVAPTVSVGIFAFDEEELIGAAVRAFSAQVTRSVTVVEVIVVSSGSSDRTVQVAHAAGPPGLVQVIDRAEREGKLVAINQFLALASGDFVIIASGDTVPEAELVEKLCRPMIDDPACGMTGPRVVQAVPAATWVASLNSLLWDLHHQVALRSPKLGEIVAVRRVIVPQLPMGAYCDEVVMEALTLQAGCRLAYVPSAVATNVGLERLGDLFWQRRRIHCQHLWARKILGYAPATLSLGNLGRSRPRLVALPRMLVLVVVEGAARAAGRVDFLRGRDYQVWSPASRSAETHG